MRPHLKNDRPFQVEKKLDRERYNIALPVKLFAGPHPTACGSVPFQVGIEYTLAALALMSLRKLS
jgi:hypothetical protein